MKGSKETLSIPAIALLIDDLRSEDQKERINSFENLGVIARALGPERTRSELLPFLVEFADDGDEVLAILAEELGEFVDLVGGSEYALTLLKPLESLVCAEESIVRNKVNSKLKG
jgi:serine/threonine-protein phosphatase 2A regulatory subunit A